MKRRTAHVEFCLKNAAHFVTAQGCSSGDRIRQQCATLPEAQAYGTPIRDGPKMIYAVQLTPTEFTIKSNDTCLSG